MLREELSDSITRPKPPPENIPRLFRKPYNEKMPRKVWYKGRQELGIKGLTLYQGSRHSLGSDAVQRGVSIYDVKDALRHKDIRTTMKYAHLDMVGKKRVILDSKVMKFPNRKKKAR